MTEDNSPQSPPIVLIHGLWLTARSWEHWLEHYRDKGYHVVAPAYPGLEVEVEALLEDPSPIEALTMHKVVKHYVGIIQELQTPPILIGHSQGGVIVQILLDLGYGVAGVAIDSVPAEGVTTLPLIKSLFPALKNPAKIHRVVGLNPEEFYFSFANALTEDESAVAYERYYIPAPGSFIWGDVLANIMPGHQATYVNFNNDTRAPLLFIAGGDDNIMPASVNKANAQHYKDSKAITDYKEFSGRCHFTIGQYGWEEVADYALDWALAHLKTTEER